jgi:hypothetical protein
VAFCPDNSAIHPASPEQRRVGCIYNGIDGKSRDISEYSSHVVSLPVVKDETRRFGTRRLVGISSFAFPAITQSLSFLRE